MKEEGKKKKLIIDFTPGQICRIKTSSGSDPKERGREGERERGREGEAHNNGQ
jgi:hypothetical protein